MANKTLITAAGGRIGGVSTHVIDLLLKKGAALRALVHKDDERAELLRKKGVEVVVGDLTVPRDVHKAIEGCNRVYYSFPVRGQYLEASLLTIAVAKKLKVEVFVNMSQLSTTLISLDSTLPSPQARAHFLAEQALEWSGVPFVNIKPTLFIENPHFTLFVKEGIEKRNEFRTPLTGRLNPIAAIDIARVISKVLLEPSSFLGKSIPLTGRALQTPDEIAKEFSSALGREIKYVPMSLEDFKETTIKQAIEMGAIDEHGGSHLFNLVPTFNDKTREIQSNEVQAITGSQPITIAQWTKEYSKLK